MSFLSWAKPTGRVLVHPEQAFTHDLTFYPDVTNFNDFRAVMDNAGEIPSSPDRTWKFKLGMKNKYESMPGGGVPRPGYFLFRESGGGFQMRNLWPVPRGAPKTIRTPPR